jgi:hypothetical protein
MKKHFKYIPIFILMFALILSVKTVATASLSEYTIEKYVINMNVRENNTFEIEEIITADFKIYQHGIFRKIPLRNSVVRNDGTRTSNTAKISDISVNEPYTTYQEGNYKVIKIGDKDRTIIGEKTYVIKYTYSLGKDPLKDADELYFNLVGTEWDTTIDNMSFTITMPKPFDEASLGFSSGTVGSVGSENVEYVVNENVIKGQLNNKLYPNDGLTIRLTLPDGYFVGAKTNIDPYVIFVMSVCLLFVLISTVLWYKFGKDNPVVETVEFYPPEGYNSAEIGFLYDGKASNESIISLLIYLADRGYLTIEEDSDLFGGKFIFNKMKEYDGGNEFESEFFNGLFEREENDYAIDISAARELLEEARKNGEQLLLEDAIEMTKKANGGLPISSVSTASLKNRFYITLENIRSKFASKEIVNSIFEPSASKAATWLKMMIPLIFILITFKSVFEYYENSYFVALAAILFPCLGFWVMFRVFLEA